MGMSASQARFLQLTARKSDVEYQAQRISFERLQLANQAGEASRIYNDKMSNRKLTYSFMNYSGDSAQKQVVDITYSNYKNYINQQLDGLKTGSEKMFLVSSSGNKIVVANEADMIKIIEQNQKTENYECSKDEILKAKEEVAQADKDGIEISDTTRKMANIELLQNEDGTYADKTYSISINSSNFNESDFLIVDDLDNIESFQKAIQDGIYFFATYGKQEGEDKMRFKTEEWDTVQGGAITEIYDTSDDAAAQAEYDKAQNQIQSMDKKLELQLNKLETERNAIQTEMESVEKVVKDNIESTFKTFS